MANGEPQAFYDNIAKKLALQQGQIVQFEGKMSVQLQPLGGYQSGTAGELYIGDPLPQQQGWGTNPWIQPSWPSTTTQPLFPPQPNSNIPGLTFQVPIPISTQYKGCFYNREAFLEFVEHLAGKVLIFMDMTEEKIVEKAEALKFVFFHFLAGHKYKNWDDFKYQDDEWCLFFRAAKEAPELLEAFDFTFDQIKEILCM
jgi:hypothetical protein